MSNSRSVLQTLAERSALLELAPDPIFALDPDRRITYWNRAAEELYGYTSGEAIGRRPRDLLKTRYPLPLSEIMRQVAETGDWYGDLIQTTRTGRQIEVASRWGAVYDDDGRMTALLEVNRDVTERRELERHRAQLERERMSTRLVRAQRLESLGHLAGGIAHDFNNLLAIILGYASTGLRHVDRLAEDGATGRPAPELLDAVRNDLRQIADASDRASLLTRQLLAFARQEAAEADVIDVGAAISEMTELLARTLGTHIRLQTHLEAAVPSVRIDPGEVGQVLVNLAVNSRAAMPDGGRLTVTTDAARFEHDRPLSHGVLPAGFYARIRVADSGSGMTRDVVEHAFDPFFTTKAVGEGTGLGLATVYGIVTRAGGQVALYSEPGLGTTVTVLLPAADRPVSAAEASAAPAPPRGAGEVVLVVEDEPALRAVTTTQLQAGGYQVVAAATGEEALRMGRDPEARIDLLLSDIVMPGLLGRELAEQLRRARPGLPVVFMSGFAQAVAGSEGLREPMLQKPFTEAELLRALHARLRD